MDKIDFILNNTLSELDKMFVAYSNKNKSVICMITPNHIKKFDYQQISNITYSHSGYFIDGSPYSRYKTTYYNKAFQKYEFLYNLCILDVDNLLRILKLSEQFDEKLSIYEVDVENRIINKTDLSSDILNKISLKSIITLMQHNLISYHELPTILQHNQEIELFHKLQ